MRFAVLADIHGNHLALEAVLADVAAQAVDAVLNLGDSFSGLVGPRQTADILAGLAMPTVRGNHDRALYEEPAAEMGRSDRIAYEALADAEIEALRSLPATLDFEGAAFLCHGTPQSDEDYWLEDIDAVGHIAPRPPAEVAALAAGIDAPVLLCGHSHLVRIVALPDGRLVVNPGSVGLPAHSSRHAPARLIGVGAPHARYAVIERRGARWSVSLRAVAYDWDAAAALARANGAGKRAEALRTGWVSGT